MVTQVLDKEKYKATILYLLNAIGEIKGKKKSYKLLYFLDFDFFEAYDKSFLGETYKSLPMGPAPVYFDAVINEMQSEGMVDIKRSRMSLAHENDTVVFTPKAKSNYNFTKEEKKMLDRIVRKYGDSTGTDLEKLSHSEAPYNSVELFQIIPYEYAIYRDTPDLIS